jgi:hypothetical protein
MEAVGLLLTHFDQGGPKADEAAHADGFRSGLNRYILRLVTKQPAARTKLEVPPRRARAM